MKNYGEKIEKVFDQGESQQNLDGYKEAAMKVLKIKKSNWFKSFFIENCF